MLAANDGKDRKMRGLLRESISLVPWQIRGVIKKMPLMAALQRRLLARFLEGHEFIHTVDAGPARGLRYPITLPQDKGIWTGTYELELATGIAEAVRPGDICLDVGGWRGFFSGVMALAGASSVFVFEPLPTNALQIRRMIELNSKLPIELIEVAIGDQINSSKLRVMPETSMAKLSTSSFQSDHQQGDLVEIRIETLDHLRATGLFPHADVIKIDVEGAEAMALRGAEQLLRSNRPRLFIEVHSRSLARECNQILLDYGYLVNVLESGVPPDFVSEPEVCHFKASRKI
jgi:FkbM family methyltransferase